mmetsp:Transcript_5987/g.17353  ORF Transcript_5987/g.17353 Transcript_5987/m.17353 type:complete len:292 (-) Transcript_5987:3199-4074(-)
MSLLSGRMDGSASSPLNRGQWRWRTRRAPSVPGAVRGPDNADRNTGKRSTNDGPDSASPTSSISNTAHAAGAHGEGRGETVSGAAASVLAAPGPAPALALPAIGRCAMTSALARVEACASSISYTHPANEVNASFAASLNLGSRSVAGQPRSARHAARVTALANPGRHAFPTSISLPTNAPTAARHRAYSPSRIDRICRRSRVWAASNFFSSGARALATLAAAGGAAFFFLAANSFFICLSHSSSSKPAPKSPFAFLPFPLFFSAFLPLSEAPPQRTRWRPRRLRSHLPPA